MEVLKRALNQVARYRNVLRVGFLMVAGVFFVLFGGSKSAKPASILKVNVANADAPYSQASYYAEGGYYAEGAYDPGFDPSASGSGCSSD